jgi:hypothetical protein
MTEPEPSDVPPPEGEASSDEVEGRRYPSTIGGMFYLVVLAGTGVGIGIVWSGNWRLGTEWMAGSLIFAALLRLVLPNKDAGMLAVRNRIFDCLLLSAVGVILIFLAVTIPNQPV